MSILPSVVTSQIPTDLRVIDTSRSTLSRQPFSPGRLNHCARNQAPDSTKSAPLSCAHACEGGQPIRAEILAPCPSCKRTNGNRVIGRAKDRRAGVLYRFARRLGHQCKPKNVGRLALIRRHPQRRIPLKMLNRAKAFLVALLHVLCGHIVLQIDPGAFLTFGHMPERRYVETFIRCLRNSASGTTCAKVCRNRCGRRMRVFDRRRPASSHRSPHQPQPCQMASPAAGQKRQDHHARSGGHGDGWTDAHWVTSHRTPQGNPPQSAFCCSG